jgi:hypothetical protein
MQGWGNGKELRQRDESACIDYRRRAMMLEVPKLI